MDLPKIQMGEYPSYKVRILRLKWKEIPIKHLLVHTDGWTVQKKSAT